MKKILISISTVAFLGVLVLGATSAFFSDTEVSENNVFTAGSVTLDLGDITHVYQDNQNDPVDGYFSTPSGTSFALNDLKPLDWGNIAFQLENGANEAHICAMVTGDPANLSDDEDIALYDLLNFWVNGSGEQVTPGEWFDLGVTAPNTSTGTGVEYCFGDANVDGTGLVSCDYGDGSIEYNDAQGGQFSADLMFYAIQTRNNDDFSCDQLTINEGVPVYIPTEPFSAEFISDEDDAVEVIGDANDDNPLDSTDSVENVYGTDAELSLTINESGDDMVFVASTPFAVTGTDNSASVLIDSDDDGIANFQFEYTNDTVEYKEVQSNNWTSETEPTGYSASMNTGQDELTVTVPKAGLSSPFRVGVNATNNGATGFGGTNVGMSIPTGDIFNGGASNWTTSTNYQIINW